MCAVLKNNKTLVLFVLIFTSFTVSFAGLLQFEGYYNGKNLFLENDFIKDANNHCITNIYVNGKHITDHPTENIVEVNLSMFKLNDTLTFRIYHKEGCTPKIINKHDIEAKTNHFAFLKFTVNENQIHWETKGEEAVGKFTVEQEMYGEWKSIKNVKASGTSAANTYYCEAHNLAGVNKYRIKYRSSGGTSYTSEIFSYQSTKPSVIFYPKRVVDFITFDTDDNREIEYSILDEKGNLLFEGKGILVDCRNLPEGVFYTIRYENKQENFYKKSASEIAKEGTEKK
jgi:hypothetical protein